MATTTLWVSVPPEVNPQSMASHLGEPLAKVATIPPRHPRFCARSQHWTGAGVSSHLFACGEAAGVNARAARGVNPPGHSVQSLAETCSLADAYGQLL